MLCIPGNNQNYFKHAIPYHIYVIMSKHKAPIMQLIMFDGIKDRHLAICSIPHCVMWVLGREDETFPIPCTTHHTHTCTRTHMCTHTHTHTRKYLYCWIYIQITGDLDAHTHTHTHTHTQIFISLELHLQPLTGEAGAMSSPVVLRHGWTSNTDL
jgi:hypothetical protein